MVGSVFFSSENQLKMVVLSLPMVSDFEGEISHVVAAGNEAMIYVKPFGWWGEWEEINAVLQSLAHSLEKITSLSAIKSGEVYVVKVKDSFERSYIIRRPLPDVFSIYLIDKGKQCEVEFGDIYEFPPVLLGFGMFSCICPVLMSSVEQINIYKSFVGYKCKCAVDAVSKSVEVIGFVRGRLLIEIEGRYKDLRDIVFGKVANRPGCSAVRTGVEFAMEFDNTKTAFKHYVPEMLPVTVPVRFDRSDRMMNSFWVVSKKIFSAAERVLKEAWNKISRYPPISLRVQDIHVRQIPCIARARADTANKALYRAIPTQYDPRTKKVSMFLVDYGWFKWVLTNDVVDISTMDKSDPIRNLPVAMIHCREDTTSPVHAKDLFKGADCEIIIKGNAMNTDMYTVDLVGPFFTSNRTGGTSSEQRPINARGTVPDNERETEMVSSCRKLVTENCQRQLMTPMMMEALNIVRRGLAQQPQNFWSNLYSNPFSMAMPMMMPVIFPVMLPMSVPNNNLQSAGDNFAVRPQKTMTNNFEGVNFSNNNARARSGVHATNNKRSPKTDYVQKNRARFQSNNSQPENELFRNDFSARNGFDVGTSDKVKQLPRNSCEKANDDDLSWDLPPKYAKRRTFPRNSDGNAQKNQLTAWEKDAAADRDVHNEQGNNPSGSGV